MGSKLKFKRSWNKLRFYLSFLLLAFYLTIGYIFLFTETWADLLPKGRTLVGTLLIFFGILRFYIAYRRYINKLARLNAAQKANDENAATE